MIKGFIIFVFMSVAGASLALAQAPNVTPTSPYHLSQVNLPIPSRLAQAPAVSPTSPYHLSQANLPIPSQLAQAPDVSPTSPLPYSSSSTERIKQAGATR